MPSYRFPSVTALVREFVHQPQIRLQSGQEKNNPDDPFSTGRICRIGKFGEESFYRPVRKRGDLGYRQHAPSCGIGSGRSMDAPKARQQPLQASLIFLDGPSRQPFQISRFCRGLAMNAGVSILREVVVPRQIFLGWLQGREPHVPKSTTSSGSSLSLLARDC